MKKDDVWNKIIEHNIATEETLQIVTCINGYTMETLNDVIYAVTGYRSLESYDEGEL